MVITFALIYSSSVMQKVDTIIHARWIIPIEPENVVYSNYSLVIDRCKILALCPTHDVYTYYQSDNSIVCSQHALVAGFVNAHTHAAMTLMRGIADDLPLMEWLQQHIWPLEQQWLSDEFVFDGTTVAVAEMLRSGTTCFNDMYFFAPATARVVKKYGIRACLGITVIDFPSAWAQSSDDYIHKGLALFEEIKGETLMTMCFAPHAPYTVSDEPLHRLKALADEHELKIHMHIHETAFEVNAAVSEQGLRPIERLRKMGVVNESFIAVHATQLTSDEIALFAQTGAHIVHCPESNLKLASGFCPVDACLKAGINVALGTDGAASNNDLDMLGEMRTAALIGKAVAQDASAIPAMTALRMATINGAKALGLDQKIGSLTVGKDADVIAIDLGELETQPLFDPISQIVYSSSRHQITDVWVAGKQLLKSRQLTTFETAELALIIEKWQKRLMGD